MSISDALVPPHSLESEQSVLGALMLSGSEHNSDVDAVFAFLTFEDFYRKDHQVLFETMRTLADGRNQAVDILTISEHLKRTKKFDDVGGDSYLGELLSTAPSLANILTYAGLIRERSVHRQLIAAGNEVTKLGYHPEDRNLEDLLDKAETCIFELSQKQIKGHRNDFQTPSDILEKVVNTLDKLTRVDSHITGFGTGFAPLDKMTAGLQRGDLIIIAGRPSMGKTSLAMNIALFVTSQKGDFILKERDGIPEVCIFSMEMGAKQLMLRMLATEGRIHFSNLRSARLNDNEWSKMLSTADTLGKRKLYIDDQSAISVHALRGRARRLQKSNPNLAMVVVDYLQLLRVDKKHDNRVAEVTEISRLLKEMARELDIPVVVLSQLNRAVDSRVQKGGLPIMSDLRDSGSIEQDADVILFIHRPEVNAPDDENLKGKAKLIISKQRNGETGIINLNFQGEFARFVDHNPALEQYAAEASGE